MISRIILTCVLLTVNNSAFKTGKLSLYEISSEIECEANRVYQKGEITCFCDEYGQWPHKTCSLAFNREVSCKPNSYVQINCNVCRCSETGIINKEFCTNHICSANPQEKIIRRRNEDVKTKCELNHWYVISSCRLCFCLTTENLICAPESKPQNIQIGKYNLTDCGTDWLNDINKLLLSVNPLRTDNRREKYVNQAYQTNTESSENVAMIQSSKDDFKVLNLKQNDIVDEKIKIARNDDRSDKNDEDGTSESDSQENVEKSKSIMRIAGNTVMPFENFVENDSNSSDDVENGKRESDNEHVDSRDESEVDEVKKMELSSSSRNENDRIKLKEQKIVKQDSVRPLLKLNLPTMLGKMFNLGLRKSMVSVKDAKCVPGSTLKVKCNTCFCLTNGKMLCTKKHCSER